MYMNKTSGLLMGNTLRWPNKNSHLEALWGYLSPQTPRALWKLLRATTPSSEGQAPTVWEALWKTCFLP